MKRQGKKLFFNPFLLENLGVFFGEILLYTIFIQKQREKIVEEEKKVAVFKKKKTKKTIYRVKWPPFLSKQVKEDRRES